MAETAVMEEIAVAVLGSGAGHAAQCGLHWADFQEESEAKGSQPALACSCPTLVLLPLHRPLPQEQ